TAAHLQLRSERHAPELRAVDVGDSVMSRKPLIDERVIGRQQLENAAVLANDAAEEELDLAPEGLAQRAVEVREQLDDGLARRDAAHVEPLPGEVLNERLRAGIRDHPLHLLLEHGRIAEAAFGRHRDQLLIRNAAPEKEGETRRQLEVADAIRRARPKIDRLDLGPIDKLRIGEDALNDGLDAVIEVSALLAPCREELHHQVDVVFRRGPPERLGRQRRDDRPRAFRLFVEAFRVALEDFLAARRARRGSAVERPFDEDLTDMRIKRIPRDRARRVHRAHERFVQARVRQVARREERNAYLMETALDRDRRSPSAVAFLVADLAIPVVEIDALAVDRDLELLTPNVAQHGGEIARHSLDREDILAVRRELVLDQHAAARPERQ